MANIFNFPPKKGRSETKEFATDASELVQFDTPERDVKMSGQTPNPLYRPQRSTRDWSNQELASIYRVKRLLDAAGVPNHVERSLSDEGDPWCIFCNTTGEVFIHLCRIDGLYILDSPNLSEAISGFDFSDLIAKFSEGALRDSEQSAKIRRRLIKLERGGKISLHPSVLLAALIWSIYLNSKDLVFFIPNEGNDVIDQEWSIGKFRDIIQTLGDDDLFSYHHLIESMNFEDNSTTIFMDSHAANESDKNGHFYKEFASKPAMALTPNAIAVGLSSIAIAYGFLSESYFEDDVLNQSESTLQELNLTTLEALEVEISNTKRVHVPQELQFMTDVDENIIIEANENRDGVLATSKLSPPIEVISTLETTLYAPEVGPADASPSFGDHIISSDHQTEATPVELILPKPIMNGDISYIKKTSSDANLDGQENQFSELLPLSPAYFSIATLKDTFSERLVEFSLGSVEIKASFDLANLTPSTGQIFETVTIMESITLAETDAPNQITSSTSDFLTSFFQRPDNPHLIDGNAISFIYHLMSKEQDVQVISYDNEIVLIDFAAFGANGNELHTMSWDLEHGGTVQTIGLKTDYIVYDLIA